MADRANAMQQWINAVEKDPSLQKAPWLLLLETDYVWVKPLQVGQELCFASLVVDLVCMVVWDLSATLAPSHGTP